VPSLLFIKARGKKLNFSWATNWISKKRNPIIRTATIVVIILLVVGLIDFRVFNQSRKDESLSGQQRKEVPAGELRNIIAPVGRYNDELVYIRPGYRLNWDSPFSFVIRNQEGDIAIHDPKRGVFQDLPPGGSPIQFKSLEDEPVEVRLWFNKL